MITAMSWTTLYILIGILVGIKALRDLREVEDVRLIFGTVVFFLFIIWWPLMLLIVWIAWVIENHGKFNPIVLKKKP